MPFELKVYTYAGFKINSVVDNTRSFANDHVNKHWPLKLRSGESESALLQCIWHNYYITVEAKSLAQGVLKTWKSSRTVAGITTTDEQAKAKLVATMKAYEFKINWYPPE